MTQRPRLLITGISGFLGRWVAWFARDAYDVVGTYYRHPVALAGCHTFPLDVRDRREVQRAVRRWQPAVVIHAAVAIGDPDVMWPVIVDGSAHVAEAAAATGARLLHISTDLVFDGETGGYTEADPPRPILPYGQAKYEAERQVRRLHPQAVVVRPSLLCHLNPPDPRTQWVLDGLAGRAEVTLFVDEYRTPAWVTDVARALVELAGHSYTGILHLAGPQRLSRYELAVRLVRALGYSPAGLRRGRSRDSGLIRPLDTSLDATRARKLLRTRLHSIDEGLQRPEVSRWPDPLEKRQAPEPGDSGAWHTTPGGERST